MRRGKGMRERGWVTVETALATLGLGAALVVCAGVFAICLAQIQCVDAAAEIARQAARDDVAAMEAVTTSLPAGSTVDCRHEGSDVVVLVSRTVRPWGPIMPGWTVEADSRAASEGG